MILIVSASHHPQSRSRHLAYAAQHSFLNSQKEVDFLDLKEITLPYCNGIKSDADHHLHHLQQRVQQAEGIVLSFPIYNYSVSAVLKSFIEHVGASLSKKPIGLMAAAGGKGSYMALLPFAGMLMADFHSYIIPQFVYATGEQFDDQGNILDSLLKDRVEELVKEMKWLSPLIAKGRIL